MGKLKVLVADDSVIFRSESRAALEKMPDVEVVGAAANGRIALQKLQSQPTDLLILDLEMPEMDGLTTLTEIERLRLPVKVIVFSSQTHAGAELALEALKRGARDFVAKPGMERDDSRSPADRIRQALEPKVREVLSTLPAADPAQATVPSRSPSPVRRSSWRTATQKAGLVVIGASTGGPTAIEKIFTSLRGTSLGCPVVIVQHMPPVFTAAFAERLASCSGLPVSEAKQMERLTSGHVYVAPGGYHLRLVDNRGEICLMLDQGAPLHGVRPAVDPLFESAAKLFGSACAGIVLTGMGEDAKIGARAIRAAGGTIAIQSKESCVVYGMPGAIDRDGSFDWILGLEEIAELARDRAVVRTALGKVS